MKPFKPPTVHPISATYLASCIFCHGKGTIIKPVSSNLNPKATNITIKYCSCWRMFEQKGTNILGQLSKPEKEIIKNAWMTAFPKEYLTPKEKESHYWQSDDDVYG